MRVDEERGVFVTVNEPKLDEIVAEFIEPGAGRLLQAVESLVKKTHVIGFGLVYKAGWLLHVNCLIQVAVALRHLESHNVSGAVILLRYGIERLQRYPAVYKGVAVARFRAQLAGLLATLEALTDPSTYQFDPVYVPRLLGTIV